ncbi:hypothetical protein NUSPORA_00530 [Nucleospora cyclopteri]
MFQFIQYIYDFLAYCVNYNFAENAIIDNQSNSNLQCDNDALKKTKRFFHNVKERQKPEKPVYKNFTLYFSFNLLDTDPVQDIIKHCYAYIIRDRNIWSDYLETKTFLVRDIILTETNPPKLVIGSFIDLCEGDIITFEFIFKHLDMNEKKSFSFVYENLNLFKKAEKYEDEDEDEKN